MTERLSNDSPVARYELAADEDVSVGVVKAVAAVTGFAPAVSAGDDATPVLEPLATSIDPDALDRLFEPTTDGTGELSFKYHGQRVTVDATGVVTVEPDGAADGVPARSPPTQGLAEQPGQ
jgi:hypothetical protein